MSVDVLPRIAGVKPNHAREICACLAAMDAEDGGSRCSFLTEEKLRVELGRSWIIGVAAWSGERVIGLAAAHETVATFGSEPHFWMDDLFVIPTARRRGLASQLLSALAAVALERGITRIDWHVLASNTDALDLYRSLDAHVFEKSRIARFGPAELEVLRQRKEQGR